MSRHTSQPSKPSQAHQRTIVTLPPPSQVLSAPAATRPPNAAPIGAISDAGCRRIVRRLTSYGMRYLSIEREPKSRSIMNSGRLMTRWYGVPGRIPRRKRTGVAEVLSNAIRFAWPRLAAVGRGWPRLAAVLRELTADAG